TVTEFNISWKAQEAAAGLEVQQTVGATGISSGLSGEPEGVSSNYAAAPFPGACGWDPAGVSSSNCSPLPGAWTDERMVTSDPTSCSLPVIPCSTNSMATVSESVFSGSLKVDAWPEQGAWPADVMASISESESLGVGAMAGVSISQGGGYVSMLTQPSLTGRSFIQVEAAAAVSTPTLSHDEIRSMVMASAEATLPIHEPPQQCMAPPSPAHHQIHSVLNTPAAAAAAAPLAALPVTVRSATSQSHFLQQEAPLSLRSAQATPTQSSGGSTRDRLQLGTREGTLYDMIVLERFKRKGSASWWGDDSIAEAPATQPLKRQCLVGGNEPGFKAPDSGSSGSGSLAAGSRSDTVDLDLPRTRVQAPNPIPAVGSAFNTFGSAAVSRPTAAATEGEALLDPLLTCSALRATQGAAEPAHSAQPTLRGQADGNGLGPDRPPIQRRSAAEKLRRHRISAGFKRLEKALPPSWMHQQHQAKMSSRTDMSSLLDAAVDFIKDLE
ncbi:unnamed protein product, partial [Closterium sp. Naga37s-1]